MSRGSVFLALAVWLVSAVPAAAQSKPPRDPLERARLLYNQGQYDAALAATDEAKRFPEQAESADLVAARVYLERYRTSSAADDLGLARGRLRGLNPARFSARERVELIVGLGETLFFDQASGAAAAVFESVLLVRGELPPEARERVLDWWASALDQGARVRSEFERQPIYQRIRDRMADELSVNGASATASYWASAAARGQGDLQAAWDAAQAGWVRAPLALDRAAPLRRDLDTLVQRAIVPERARVLGRPPEALLADWEEFKAKWSQ